MLYASKWNLIEHRLFTHIHRAMSGFIFSDYQTVKSDHTENTSIKTGLSVIVRLNLELYQIGIKGEKVTSNRIQHHPKIPKLTKK